MLKRACTTIGTVLAATGVPVTQGLEIDPHVPPQVDIGGRAIVTTDLSRSRDADGDWDSDERLEPGDSSLIFGFSKNLFDDEHYAYGDFGIKLAEDDSEHPDELFPHRVFVGVGGRYFDVGLGRRGLPNTLVRFPTLRDDDLLAFTHIANAFSNAQRTKEYTIYGGQAAAIGYLPQYRLSFNASALALVETDPAGEPETFTNFNAASVGAAYAVPREMRFTRGFRFIGVNLFSQNVGAEDDSWIHALVAGTVAVLNNNPEGPVTLDLQGIHNFGTDVEDLGQPADRALAEYSSVATAIRYRHMPYLQTRWQAGLTVAWKDYRDFGSSREIALAPSYAYRLGSGVELLAQYRYLDRQQGLAGTAAKARRDHRFQVGLSFSFDYTINPTVHQRDSILFLEHDMLQIGPTRGGD